MRNEALKAWGTRSLTAAFLLSGLGSCDNTTEVYGGNCRDDATGFQSDTQVPAHKRLSIGGQLLIPGRDSVRIEGRPNYQVRNAQIRYAGLFGEMTSKEASHSADMEYGGTIMFPNREETELLAVTVKKSQAPEIIDLSVTLVCKNDPKDTNSQDRK